MTGLELVAAVAPPASAALLGLTLRLLVDRHLHRQGRRVAVEIGADAGAHSPVAQATSAAGTLAQLPAAMLAFLVTLLVTAQIGRAWLAILAALGLAWFIVLAAAAFTADLRELHGRVRHPLRRRGRPLPVTYVDLIELSMIGANLLIVAAVLVAFALG